MTTPAEAPSAPTADLAAPLQTVQSAAVDFSSDLLTWLERSPLHALMMMGIIAACGLLLALLRRGLLRVIGHEQPHRRNWRQVANRLVRASSVLFLLVLGAWVTDQFIRLPKGVTTGINLAFLITGFFQIGLFAREIILLLVERRLARGLPPGDQPVSNALGVIGWLISLCVWSVVLLVLLDNLGVNVTALVAGLGIGGLALGLAAQGIISDLFSALSIIFDRPFTRGDMIAFGDKQGVVERIGLKTSRLRALTGETLVISNNKLLGEVIHNHQQMSERRMLFRFGLDYASPPHAVAAVPDLVRDIVSAQPECRFDRAHFVQLGDSALIFEVVYYFARRDYVPYLDAHQTILLALMRGLSERGLSFAFPTQTIYLQRASRSNG